jgi:hypothetical protein
MASHLELMASHLQLMAGHLELLTDETHADAAIGSVQLA